MVRGLISYGRRGDRKKSVICFDCRSVQWTVFLVFLLLLPLHYAPFAYWASLFLSICPGNIFVEYIINDSSLSIQPFLCAGSIFCWSRQIRLAFRSNNNVREKIEQIIHEHTRYSQICPLRKKKLDEQIKCNEDIEGKSIEKGFKSQWKLPKHTQIY